MHDSHKLWIMIAVFLVVIGLLVGMYLTATPSKMNSVIEKQKALKERKMQEQNNASSKESENKQQGM